MDTWYNQQPDALEQAKAALGRVIAQTMQDRGLDCDGMAELLITECSAIKDLFRQQLDRFTLATLLCYAGALNISLISLDKALSGSQTEFELQRGMV